MAVGSRVLAGMALVFLCAHNEEFLPVLVTDLLDDPSHICIIFMAAVAVGEGSFPAVENVAGSVSEVAGQPAL